MKSADAPFVPHRSRRVVQDDKSSARWLQIILDQILVVALSYGHTILKGAAFETEYRALAVLTVLLMAVIYQANGVYAFTVSLADRFFNQARAWAIVLALIIIVGFITKTSERLSREVLIIWAFTGYLAQCLAYFFVNAIQSRSKEEIIPTLLIGARELGQHLATNINDNQWIPDQIIGVLEDSDLHKNQWKLTDVPVLRRLDDIEQVIQDHRIRRVYIALPMQQSALVKPIYLNLAERNIDVIWAPDIFGVNLLNHSVREIAGVPIISLSETPLIGSAAFMKAVMDFSIAIGALIITAPIMLATAALIKLTSSGPILFSQQRHGWDGEIITVYKFRSMKLHEEQAGQLTQASKKDDQLPGSARSSAAPALTNCLSYLMYSVAPCPLSAHDLTPWCITSTIATKSKLTCLAIASNLASRA